jgi:cobalt-precorrin-5B (C1)-methyltransferase
MDLMRNVNGTLLRCGYTTGSCAAAAAKAAAIMLLSGETVGTVSLTTPKGVKLVLDVSDAVIARGGAGVPFASCAIRKDAGDDPDVTDGSLICARVETLTDGVVIDGGGGVGRVTEPGLDQPVGAAAINSVPRRMIGDELRSVAKEYGYDGGFRALISVPDGGELAKRTFNPRLGIVGGISIIGTTGIVEPMSHAAIAETVRLGLRRLAERTAAQEDRAKRVLLSPGNYGETFARETLRLNMNEHVACSNYIGEAIDGAVELGFTRILLVGHIGKLVKLGLGITNTHSAFGDGRMEALIACALNAGADKALLMDISRCVAVDAALTLLYESNLLTRTMRELGGRISATLSRRVPAHVEIAHICFTNAEAFAGILTQSDNADNMRDEWGAHMENIK